MCKAWRFGGHRWHSTCPQFWEMIKKYRNTKNNATNEQLCYLNIVFTVEGKLVWSPVMNDSVSCSMLVFSGVWARTIAKVNVSFEPRLSILDFVSQLWRKTEPKLQDEIQKALAWGPTLHFTWLTYQCRETRRANCLKIVQGCISRQLLGRKLPI